MFRQVIRPHESLGANRAGESLFSRMRSEVPLQLVGSGESLPAEQPVAHERSLACMPPQMSLEMRSFPVHFITAWIMADVHFLRRRLLQPVLFVYTVGTLAFDTPPRFRGVSREVHPDFWLDHLHRGREGGHIIRLWPLRVLLVLVLLGLVTTCGYVGRRRRMLEPVLVAVSVTVWRLIMRGIFQRRPRRFQRYLGDVAVAAAGRGGGRRQLGVSGEGLVRVHSVASRCQEV